MMTDIENTNKNNQVSLWQYAINYGLIIGILWALKFLALAKQDVWSPLIYLHFIINVVVIVVLYIAYHKYRDSDPQKMQRRLKCVVFMVALCLFASLIECSTMFLLFKTLDPLYFSTKIEPALLGMMNSIPYPDEVKTLYVGFIQNYGEEIHILSTFMGNLVFGGIIGLLFALVIGKRKLS